MKRGKRKDFELRKSVRLPVSLPVMFRLFDVSTREPSPTTIYGQIRNISFEGLCLETNTTSADNCDIFLSCLRGRKLLQLEVKLPKVGKPLRLQGKLLWYDRRLPGSTYQFFAGIYITEATERSRKLWQEYVEEHKGGWLKTWSKIFPKKGD